MSEDTDKFHCMIQAMPTGRSRKGDKDPEPVTYHGGGPTEQAAEAEARHLMKRQGAIFISKVIFERSPPRFTPMCKAS